MKFDASMLAVRYMLAFFLHKFYQETCCCKIEISNKFKNVFFSVIPFITDTNESYKKKKK